MLYFYVFGCVLLRFFGPKFTGTKAKMMLNSVDVWWIYWSSMSTNVGYKNYKVQTFCIFGCCNIVWCAYFPFRV